MEPDDLATAVRPILDATLGVARGTDLEAAVRDTRQRLDEPLRVAIAGRVKAGKSTLLNALVGERLAATDAGECTRIVTWYRNALGYRVVADLRDGSRRDLTFSRRDGALDIDLGGLEVADVDRLDVGWPSAKLAELTLIDTPGLASATEGTSARPSAPFSTTARDRAKRTPSCTSCATCTGPTSASSRRSWTGRSLTRRRSTRSSSCRGPTRSARRPDALDSAAAVAQRYAGDARVRELASGVVPVAGLIAETGATLRETQVGWLRRSRGAPRDEPRSVAAVGRAVPRPGPQPAQRGDPRGAAGAARPVRAPAVGRAACRWDRPDRDRPVRRASSSVRASGTSRGRWPIATVRGPRHSRHGRRWRLSASSRNRWTGAVSTARRTSSWRSTDSIVVAGAGAPAAPPRADRRRRAVGRKG